MAKLHRVIDFTKEKPCEVFNMGYMNEHNATVITVTAPESLSIENGADLICVAIETGGAIVRSALQENRTVEFALTRECTGSEYFNLQVEGYSTEKDENGKNKFVGRSKMIKGLRLLPSVQGEDGYEKAEGVEEKIATALSNYASKESLEETKKDLTEKVETILTDYATNTSVTEIKDELEEKILINSVDIQSTEQELTEKIDGVNSDLSTAKEEINASILVETTAREKGDTDTLTSAKAYTDEKVANIDLSNYYTKDETYTKAETDEKIATIETELAKKQNNLTAGQNVTLDNDTVSVDLSEYEKTADVDTKLAKKQDVLTAGDNVKIESNTVSVDLSAYAKTTDLSAYAKTSDLGVYATQTYVQDEIQAAVYDVMEASY